MNETEARYYGGKMEDGRCSEIHNGEGKFALWEAALTLQSSPVKSDDFLSAVKQCIDEDCVAEVLDLVCSETFKGVVEFIGWEMIGVLFPHFNEVPLKEVYIEIIKRLNEVCSPKEIILGFTENLDAILTLQCLKLCLVNLQTAIIKLNWKSTKTVNMCCEDVARQFKRLSRSGVFDETSNSERIEVNDTFSDNESCNGLSTSMSHNQSNFTKEDSINESTKCLNSNELVEKRMCCMIDAGLSFVSCFANGMLSAGSHFHEEDTKAISVSFLCNMLVNPLSWYSILGPVENDSRSLTCSHCNENCRSISNRLLEAIFSLKVPVVRLLKSGMTMKDAILENEAKAMLSYLILVKDIGSRSFPFVLSPQVMFELNLKPMLQFLKRTDLPGRKKALELAKNIMHRLSEESLPNEKFTWNEGVTIFQALIEVMITDNQKDVRKQFLELFSFSISRFEHHSRLEILRDLISTVSHSGAIGFLIQSIKNEAVEMNRQDQDDSALQCASNRKFRELLCLSLDPLMAPECDVVMESERMIAALNFLRYLLLRSQRTDDKYGVLANFSMIDKSYLSPLHEKTDAAFVECRNAFVETEMEAKAIEKEGKERCSLKVDQLNLESNLQGIQLTMNTLDIIRCLLARIYELHKGMISG